MTDQPIVVVTGSSGLVGSALVRRLAARCDVVGFDRDGQPKSPPQVDNVCVDLTDAESVRLGFARVAHAHGDRIAAIVHLAAYYDFSGEPSDLYDEVTVRGTGRLLTALRESGCRAEALVYASTMLVHAPTEPGQPIDESSPLEAKWDYPRSKLRTERLLADERGDLPVLMLRMAGVYTDRCNSIPLAQQLVRIADRSLEGHVYPGDVDHGQAFVHLDDLVDALELAVDRAGALPDAATPLLLGEPETPSYAELQRRFAALLHADDGWSTRRIPKPLARAGAWIKDQLPSPQFVKPWMIELADDHYELDVSRARQLLGWEPKHRLLATLPRMVEDYQRDPAVWRQRHGLGDGAR